ncbi:hypothetical protein DFJ77DRAFT_512327 [Powellomyces hirtus]|nr:hypothetical protein DFJ77DRAFT_512327 [Powellomyces hirtus]
MDVDRNNSPSPDTTTTTTTAKRRNNQQLQKAAAKKVQLAGEPTVHYNSTPEVAVATSTCWKCGLHKGGKMFLGECHHMICRPCIVALADATDTGPLGQFVCGVDRCGRMLHFGAIPVCCVHDACPSAVAALRWLPCAHVNCMAHICAEMNIANFTPLRCGMGERCHGAKCLFSFTRIN